MSEKFETSKETGHHAQLSKLAGNWEGMTKTWLEPGKDPDQSPIKGSMKSILGGRFVLHEYTGSLGDTPLEGIAIFGYDLNLGKFQIAWIDSFHNGTAILFSESKRGEEHFNVLGSYTYIAPDMEHHWGWRTELKIVNENEVQIIAYNVSPEGEEFKATETIYKRIK